MSACTPDCKMGAKQSKHQGTKGPPVLAQMKSLLGGRKPAAPASPPPSPSSLATTLASPQLVKQFSDFLSNLETGLHNSSKCGLADMFHFVVDVRRLQLSGLEGPGPWTLEPGLPESWSTYFPTSSATGLRLQDPGLFRRCSATLRSEHLTPEGRRSLQLAEENCRKQLQGPHSGFRANRVLAARGAGPGLPCCVL